MGERLERRKLGNVTLVYSPESEAIAANVLGYAAKCNEYLAKLFEPEAPVQQTVHWLAKHDWRGRPESYGFPYASGRDAILAAADVDLPTQLALIADDMEIGKGGPAIDRLAQLLGLPEGSTPAEVREHLHESKEFFVVFTAYFILPHELTHGFCNALDYPQNPRWFYEGIAQWAAYHIQKGLRSEREAEMIYEYYQLLWERGRSRMAVQDFAQADELGAGKLSTPNYAWYHAGLLRMFRDLEQMKGQNPLPDLIRAVGKKHRGRRDVPLAEMIGFISEVVGRDLRPWFATQWGLAADD